MFNEEARIEESLVVWKLRSVVDLLDCWMRLCLNAISCSALLVTWNICNASERKIVMASQVNISKWKNIRDNSENKATRAATKAIYDTGATAEALM